MNIADKQRTLKIRTNTDRAEDASQARELGAEGIRLCRTVAICFSNLNEFLQ